MNIYILFHRNLTNNKIPSIPSRINDLKDLQEL